MTDYKQLCAELVAAWDDLPWHYDWKGNLIGLADGCQLDDSAVERARAALAEQETEGPTDEQLDELFVEIDQTGSPESWRIYARTVITNWGN